MVGSLMSITSRESAWKRWSNAFIPTARKRLLNESSDTQAGASQSTRKTPRGSDRRKQAQPPITGKWITRSGWEANQVNRKLLLSASADFAHLERFRSVGFSFSW